MPAVYSPIVVPMSVSAEAQEVGLIITAQPSAATISIGTELIISTRPDAETYAGPYEVSPQFDEQVLETADKLMSDDVTVHAIEVARVSNPSGGKTVYIGGVF